MVDFSSPSIREQLVQALETRLNTMVEGQPVADPYAITFSKVQRQPFGSDIRGKKLAAAIFDLTEFKSPDTNPVIRSTINVIIEFICQVAPSENPTEKMNLVFSEVERRIKEDVTFGGLSYDATITQTETDIDGRFDKTAEGALYLDIKYRHNHLDPRAAV